MLFFRIWFFVGNIACIVQTIGQAHGIWKCSSWDADIFWSVTFIFWLGYFLFFDGHNRFANNG